MERRNLIPGDDMSLDTSDGEGPPSAYQNDATTVSSSEVRSRSELSSIQEMLDDDAGFDSLRINSLLVSSVPEQVHVVEDVDDDVSLFEESSVEEECDVQQLCSEGLQYLELTKLAIDTQPHSNKFQAHLDGGSQASTTNDRSLLWGYKPFSKKHPCRVRLVCADGKAPVIPTGFGVARIPAENEAGYVPIKCYYTPEIPNFIVGPKSFEALLGQDCRGYQIDTNNDEGTFQLSLKSKSRKSQDVLLIGEMKGGLCFTGSAIPPLPTSEITEDMTLEQADKAGISMIEDHPQNSVVHEMKLHHLSAKQERLLWHQRLGHCGDEQLAKAHEFCEGIPKISAKAKSIVEECHVCLAANMKSRARGDGVTRTATVPGQGLSIDFAFAGQHSKNSYNPDRMRVNDYMGLNGETCYLLIYDHATERLSGICKQSKAPPVKWLRKWLETNVEEDVKDRYVFMDQGGELYKCKAIRDLFEEFNYEIRPTGTAAHHQNGLVERANQTVDKAIRAMLFGAGLEVKFWPYAFYHFLMIKNAALPRRGEEKSAYEKQHGKKSDMSKLRTFGCRLWVKILAWRNKAKYVQDTKKGIFLGYRTDTKKNVVWYDPQTKRVKYGYHVRFDEGYNDLPLANLPPNVIILDRHDSRVEPETITISLPTFSTSEHPFFDEDDVTIKVVCKHPTFGFVLEEDTCMQRAFIREFTADKTRKKYSCGTILSSGKSSRNTYRGAFITAINDEEMVTKAQVEEKFAELRSKGVDSFTMTLAKEPKPSAQATRRAYDEIELPEFDLDASLGSDYYTTEPIEEAESSLSTSGVNGDASTVPGKSSYIPEIGTEIEKEFSNGKYYHGVVIAGPFERKEKRGRKLQDCWKILYDDGDVDEMTALEVDAWRKPVQEVKAATRRPQKGTKKATQTPAQRKKARPSGDHVEELPQVSAPTNKRRSTRLQQQSAEEARLHFLESNPYLPMDSISMYEAATCRIHLNDTDPYEELLHNVDEVETLLQDPEVLSAIYKLLDPDSDLDDLKIQVLQSEAITPEEQALPRFSRRALQKLPTWDLWHKNEIEQLDQMKALGMFGDPVPLPDGAILMRFHWQYRIKVNGKRRSRVCCDGSPRAAPEVHSSTNTYASCLEHPIYRLFIALCAADGLTIYGGDAKDAFAHSPGPSKPTFMKVDNAFREWYHDRTGVLLDKDLVLPVLRALQGHPEAARLWEQHISSILKDLGFTNTTHEKNIYVGTFCGEKVLLVRQVDDFALGCKAEATARHVFKTIGDKLTLHNESDAPFEFLGLVDSFDGYDVLQTRDYIKLSAESYIRRLLKAHGWENPSPREDTRKPKPPLHESDLAGLFNLPAGPKENTPEHADLAQRMGFGYRSVLGEILFAYVLCRPDIGYAVTTLAKFSTAPNEHHYKALKHLAIYLRQTQSWGIHFWRSNPVEGLPEVPFTPMTYDDALPTIPPPTSLHQLVTHVDAAHANELRQRRSTTGYGCCLAGGVVAYRSRTQSICAQSSTEAELIAANAAAKVTKYLRFVLHELGYTQQEPTPIYEDNDSAIKIVNHNRPTDRSRHIEIRFFALQHWRLMGDIVLVHLPGVVNPADMLTKALGWVLHHRHAPYLMGHYGNPCR